MEQPIENQVLPSPKALEDWLNLKDLSDFSVLSDLWDKNLLQPLGEFLDRPSKNFRASLVRLGFELVKGSRPNERYLPSAQAVLEYIHAASLVVDDIQDNSDWRRGEPTLHRKVGLAVALNSANWLYFWPFEIMDQWNLSSEQRLSLSRKCHRALIRAHSGQALDVGVAISDLPQDKVRAVCLASLELKTGALTALAFELGAELGGASFELLKIISDFGNKFGIALQMFDDLGNTQTKIPSDPKQFEDLKNKRPSWVWASAAQYLDSFQYQEFLNKVAELPETESLENYLSQADWMKRAFNEACEYLDQAWLEFRKKTENQASLSVIEEIEALVDKLKRSYGT